MKQFFCLFSLAAWGFLLCHQSRAQDSRPRFSSAFPLDALRNVSSADAKISAEVLIRKFVEKEGYNYSTEILKNHSSLLSGIKANEYDFFLIFAYEYLAYEAPSELNPRLIGVQTLEESLSQFVLLINGDSKIEELGGSEIKIQRGSGKLPMIWLEEQLANCSIPNPENFFKKIVPSDSANESVLSVFFGKTAACIVTKESFDVMAELNPQIQKKLTQVAVSEPLLNTIICTHTNFKEIVPKSLEDIGTKLHREAEGKQILSLMRVEKLDRFEPKMLESLVKLLNKRKQRLAKKNESG